MGIRCADHVTPLYPQKLALTSPAGGGRSVGIVRSRTKATGFFGSKHHRTAAENVTAELSIHRPFPQKQPDYSFTNPTFMIQLQLLNLSLLNTTPKPETDGVMIIKPGRLMTGNT